MLDACATQGAGLQGLSVQTSPRLVVMASHDDRPSELPLLWSLCAAWTDLGYPVVVLDATQTESPANPGLQQLLNPSGRPEDMPHDTMDTAWSIYPAALGLRQLCAVSQHHGEATPLDELDHLFPNYDVVLLYVNADMLATSLPGSTIEPLLAISTNKRSVLTAYQALKQLLLNGRLQPTIVSMVDASDQSSLTCGRNMSQSLQGCAVSFLGRQITTLSVDIQQTDEEAPRDVNRLALRLLESGMPCHPDSVTPTRHRALNDNDSGKRSH
jgi:hypothetical protein